VKNGVMEYWSNGVLGFEISEVGRSGPTLHHSITNEKCSHMNSTNQHVRVLLAKVGLDGHDRGLKIVARALRDAGIEVVYLGIHNTAAEIVRSAVQEDVDAIGISIHSAAHLSLFKELAAGLKRNHAGDIAVFAGGIIPVEDFPTLKKLGVKKIFGPGAPLGEIVECVKMFKGRGSKHSTVAKRHEL
jgi:methylmalonyl-CoA mutase, C-terminal domain